MLRQRQVIDIALELPGARADNPFESDPSITVFRHGGTGKWFGILMKAPRRAVGLAGDGTTEVLDLKCDPLVSFGLRQEYADIVPGYHMNKHHWITVRLEGGIAEDLVKMLVRMSYDLTRKPGRRRKQPDSPTP